MLKRIYVGDMQRALVTRNGRFVRVLGPGAYWLSLRDEVEIYGVVNPAYSGDWAEVLIRQAPEEFTLVETKETEVAIVRCDGVAALVLAPGRRQLFWKGLTQVEAEVIDWKQQPEVPTAALPGLKRIALSLAQATFIPVDEGRVGLLFLDNKYARTLEPGIYGFWNAANARVELVDVRVQPIEIPGQEILTKDKVSLRVNISGEYRVTDPVAARAKTKDAAGTLYRALQLAVRQSLGRKTLDELLAEKVDVEPAIAEAVRKEMAELGIELIAVALKDIVLPGEVRDILNQVVAAEKQAQANLIRRREETAATRSLVNTAKLLEGSPVLVRLKELETLEKLTEKVDRITVTGGFEGLLTQLIETQAAAQAK